MIIEFGMLKSTFVPIFTKIIRGTDFLARLYVQHSSFHLIRKRRRIDPEAAALVTTLKALEERKPRTLRERGICKLVNQPVWLNPFDRVLYIYYTTYTNTYYTKVRKFIIIRVYS